jgi:hypothetical protein
MNKEISKEFCKIEPTFFERYAYGDYIIEVGFVSELSLQIKEVWLYDPTIGVKKLLFGKDMTDASTELELLQEVGAILDKYAIEDYKKSFDVTYKNYTGPRDVDKDFDSKIIEFKNI